MEQIKLSEYGSKMMGFYDRLQKLSEEVYETKEKEFSFNDTEMANEIYDEVNKAFDNALSFMRKQILDDAETYILSPRNKAV